MNIKRQEYILTNIHKYIDVGLDRFKHMVLSYKHENTENYENYAMK